MFLALPLKLLFLAGGVCAVCIFCKGGF